MSIFVLIETQNMRNSISFYLVLLVLKLKGKKRLFSQVPLDVRGLRRDDVKVPRGTFYKSNAVRNFEVDGFKVTALETESLGGRLMIYLHGGAFVSGPGQHHWDTIKKIHKDTGINIWLVDYPKAPEYTVDKANKVIDALYQKALEVYTGKDIILMGDSAGGNLCISLTQRIIRAKIDKPALLILVSPVIDASFSNPAIKAIDPLDPILSIDGVRSANELFAGNKALTDPTLSPIFESLEGFPKVIMYVGDRDICAPDEIEFAKELKAQRVDLDLIREQEMIHIWPLLPVMKEASIALNDLIEKLKLKA
jgi:acetyl esterase/lipase